MIGGAATAAYRLRVLAPIALVLALLSGEAGIVTLAFCSPMRWSSIRPCGHVERGARAELARRDGWGALLVWPGYGVAGSRRISIRSATCRGFGRISTVDMARC